MKLSKRLEMVASFVHEGSNLADIGTDHGYIPIALVEREKVPGALAMDVRKGPLERAENHIQEHGLEEKIRIRLSDGAAGLQPGEADTVVIAGMGGELVIHILEGAHHLWEDVKQWVLSPQSELNKVRDYLENQGFLIAREAMVEEDGKYYTVMDVARGRMKPMSPAGRHYGEYLIKTKDPVLGSFLERERKQMEQILTQMSGRAGETAGKRVQELEQQLGRIKEAQNEMR